MSSITQVENNAAAYEAQRAESTEKKTKINGRTIGEPKLSEKAQKYYEQLKKKYSDMDFILVSKDKIDQAKAQAGSYANPNRMVVLIDEEKIEKMAEDEEYRKKYESVISNAGQKLPQLQKSLAGTNANVKTFGMQVNDHGNASFFAVIDKSLKAQKDRIAQKASDKKAAQKAADKKAKAKKADEKAAQKLAEKKDAEKAKDEDTVTITASSIEELIQKINDYSYTYMSDNVRTESEKMIGQSIDYRW